MNNEIFTKISDLLLFAVNFSKGDKITLTIEYNLRDMGKSLVRRAYERGAAYVELNYMDHFLRAEAIRGTCENFYLPDYKKARQKEITRQGWKSIGIYSNAESDVFKDLSRKRFSEYFKFLGDFSKDFREAIMSNKIPWTLTFLPSEKMASKAFPGDTPKKAVSKYWDEVIRIMHLDEADPVAFWKVKMDRDRERTDMLNSLNIDFLHFKGPDTDLKVGLNSQACWIGGFDYSLDNQKFISNIPTDEIFTTPDFRKTEGRVKLTKPFVMHQNIGPVIEGGWFLFEDGMVTEYGAEKGKESLDAFFDIDERAKYLGEVALVDPESPFSTSGTTFFNGLYDENAACHLALGKAYPFTLKEKGDFSDTELLQIGFNTGNIHEDMMVGGTKVDVSAVLLDGSIKEIIKDGKFLI